MDTKQCSSCGQTVPFDARFCPACGAQFVAHRVPPKRTGCLQKVGIGFLALFAIGLLGTVFGGTQHSGNSAANNATALQSTVEIPISPAPTNFAGKRWRSRPTPDLKVFMPTTQDGLSLFVPRHKPKPFEGLPVSEEDFQFDHQKLYGGDIYIDGGEKNEKLAKDTIVRIYGPPTFVNEDLHIYRWKWLKERVEVALSYQEKHGRTTLAYSEGNLP